MLRQPTATFAFGPVLPKAPINGFVRRLQVPAFVVQEATNVKRVHPGVDRQSDAHAWLLFTRLGMTAIESPAMSTFL